MGEQQPEPDEPGSVEYNYQVWRQSRNEQVILDTSAQAEDAGMWFSFGPSFDHRALTMGAPDHCRWDRPVSTIPTAGFPAQMAFHAYDPHLVVTNEHDSIRYGSRGSLGMRS